MIRAAALFAFVVLIIAACLVAWFADPATALALGRSSMACLGVAIIGHAVATWPRPSTFTDSDIRAIDRKGQTTAPREVRRG